MGFHLPNLARQRTNRAGDATAAPTAEQPKPASDKPDQSDPVDRELDILSVKPPRKKRARK